MVARLSALSAGCDLSCTPMGCDLLYLVTDADAAGPDNAAPDAEGDVVLSAKPGQRVQNPRVGGPGVRVPGGDDTARHGGYDAQDGFADGDLLPAPAVLGPGASAGDHDAHAEPARVGSSAAELRGECLQRCFGHQRHGLVIVTELLWVPQEQVHLPAEVAGQRGA